MFSLAPYLCSFLSQQQLKTLTVILRNLIDPTKGGSSETDDSIKYRTLKLDNIKLQQRLFCVPYIQEMLVSVVGFTYPDTDKDRLTTLVMTNPPSMSTVELLTNHILPAIAKSQLHIVSQIEKVESQKKKVKLSTEAPSLTVPTIDPATSKMTEKQKARLIMEEKVRQEKENAKLARKLTQAQIAADKKVRMEDDNWKPCVSAAAAKTGTGMLTFRDRHGE
jgi:hypothetical protein